MLAAVGDDAEDGLVLLDARPVDDLDEVQLADRLLASGPVKASRAAVSSVGRSQPLSTACAVGERLRRRPRPASPSVRSSSR